MGPYPVELRRRVVEAYLEGEGTLEEIAERFRVSLHFVTDMLTLYRQTGDIQPRPHGGGPVPRLDAVGLEQLRAMVETDSDATLAELSERIARELHMTLGVARLCKLLQTMGLPRKKKILRADERERPEVIEARFEFCEKILEVDPLHLVFVDEFGTNLSMTRWYARAPVGERAYDSAPMDHGGNVTLVMGLRLTGVVAPLMFPGSMTNEAFDTYTEKSLAPSLRCVMDRLSPHKQPCVAAAIEAAGATLLLLSPYSPDFSPVEACGSKVKTALRGAAARTYELLLDAARDALDDVSPSDAVGWFLHYGYLSPLTGKPH
jgi:transposase